MALALKMVAILQLRHRDQNPGDDFADATAAASTTCMWQHGHIGDL
jgi:hypothetical protein